MGNSFFEASFFLTKRSKNKIYNSNYIGLCVKTAFKNNFGLPEVPQPENAWKRKWRFSISGTSHGPKLFLKAVFTQSHIWLLFKKKKAFRLKKWRFKNWTFHCIFKMWFDHGRVTFLAKKNSEKAKHPKICVSFGGSMPIAQIKRCHLTPSPALECFPQMWYY